MMASSSPSSAFSGVRGGAQEAVAVADVRGGGGTGGNNAHSQKKKNCHEYFDDDDDEDDEKGPEIIDLKNNLLTKVSQSFSHERVSG